VKWILWSKLKTSNNISVMYLIKIILLKYVINPILFKSSKASKDNFSQFGIIASKEN